MLFSTLCVTFSIYRYELSNNNNNKNMKIEENIIRQSIGPGQPEPSDGWHHPFTDQPPSLSSVVLLGNPSEARTEGKEGERQGREILGGRVHLPGICPFIWFGMCGAGGPPLTIPSEGMLWPWGGWGGGPLWFIPPGPMGMFWVGGCRRTA